MKPRNWKQGDPISAARLNDTNTDAARSRRQFSLGSGSSMVNETMGNNSSLAHEAGARFVIAIEDFAVVNAETDIYALNDPQYHGLCKMMRLNSGSAAPTGLYEEEVNSEEFRVWDPVALLTSSASKVMGDVFYTVYNKDSKRWEVLTGGGTGTHEIWFTVIDAYCPYPEETILTVLPTFYTGRCTGSLPGQDSYTCYITVEDACTILKYYRAEDLIGRTGRATYMYPYSCGGSSYSCIGVWLVDTICGTPECA